MGMPVFAYNINGINDIIVHKKTGYLFNDKNDMLATFNTVFKSKRFDKARIRNNLKLLLRNDQIFKQLRSLFYDKT